LQIALHELEGLRGIAPIECDVAQLQQRFAIVRTRGERTIEKFLGIHEVARAARARTCIAQRHPRRLVQRIDRHFEK
jgi:hypothetical protein